ncbi:MAG: hypothetical protein Q8L66_04385 [Caulobacter sp.]|nr:hypothetical protein [Caulobacter sp.]
MDRRSIASVIAEDLFDAEGAVDVALAKAAGLMRRLVAARRQLGLPIGTGEPVLRRATATVEALGVAQREIARLHGELDGLRLSLGLPDLGFGPLVKPPAARSDAFAVD